MCILRNKITIFRSSQCSHWIMGSLVFKILSHWKQRFCSFYPRKKKPMGARLLSFDSTSNLVKVRAFTHFWEPSVNPGLFAELAFKTYRAPLRAQCKLLSFKNYLWAEEAWRKKKDRLVFFVNLYIKLLQKRKYYSASENYPFKRNLRQLCSCLLPPPFQDLNPDTNRVSKYWVS